VTGFWLKTEPRLKVVFVNARHNWHDARCASCYEWLYPELFVSVEHCPTAISNIAYTVACRATRFPSAGRQTSLIV